jgi:hypothetical protein
LLVHVLLPLAQLSQIPYTITVLSKMYFKNPIIEYPYPSIHSVSNERAKSNRGHVIYSAHHAAIIGGFHKLGFEAYVEDIGLVNI